MSGRLLALGLGLASATALGSDALLEGGAAFTTTSADNPRTGNASVNGVVDYSLGPSWEVSASLQYLRDFATKTSETTARGSNVFLIGASAIFAPSEHWLTMLLINGSPPSDQRNATTVTWASGKSADVVIDSHGWTLGGLWTGAYSTGGLSDFESTVDLVLGVNHFDVFQQAELPNTARSQALRSLCDTTAGKRTNLCALVNGTSTPLFQARLGAGYLATLFGHTDLGLDAAYYLYDRDPATVGYFSVVALGDAVVGAGLPVLPLQLSVKPSVTRRFEHFVVRLSYQLGLYPDGSGSNHLFGLKVTWKVSKLLRFWVNGTGQLDLGAGGAVQNPGGSVLLGTMVSW